MRPRVAGATQDAQRTLGREEGIGEAGIGEDNLGSVHTHRACRTFARHDAETRGHRVDDRGLQRTRRRRRDAHVEQAQVGIGQADCMVPGERVRLEARAPLCVGRDVNPANLRNPLMQMKAGVAGDDPFGEREGGVRADLQRAAFHAHA